MLILFSWFDYQLKTKLSIKNNDDFSDADVL